MLCRASRRYPHIDRFDDPLHPSWRALFTVAWPTVCSLLYLSHVPYARRRGGFAQDRRQLARSRILLIALSGCEASRQSSQSSLSESGRVTAPWNTDSMTRFRPDSLLSTWARWPYRLERPYHVRRCQDDVLTKSCGCRGSGSWDGVTQLCGRSSVVRFFRGHGVLRTAHQRRRE